MQLTKKQEEGLKIAVQRYNNREKSSYHKRNNSFFYGYPYMNKQIILNIKFRYST